MFPDLQPKVPIVIQLLRNRELCGKYDIKSVRMVYTGAAPLGAETHEDMVKKLKLVVDTAKAIWPDEA